MDGLFTYFWWYVVGVSYFMGVCYFAVGMMFDGGDDWWLPFVLPVAVPLFWVHENRIGVASVLAILMLLVGVPVLCSKVF